MSTASTPIRVDSATQLVNELGSAPALLLSASVPYQRELPSGLNRSERERFQRRNQHYLDSMQPQRIRSAVIELTRATLMRHARVVFGAHPAISPMVLIAARDAGAPPRSIVVFQSAHFEDRIPEPTLVLADWQAGQLVITAARHAPSEHESKDASLQFMRELMVSVPGLLGAVFVGGMEGVAHEAALFRQAHPTAPCYALASTGSAALDLHRQQRSAFKGTLQNDKLLSAQRSYAVVARGILDDLGLPRPDGPRSSQGAR